MHSYLEKHDPDKNQARFYNMVLLPNLFGEWTLYREWGRIGQGGKVRMEWFDSEDEAKVALSALETAKRRRGYWLRHKRSTTWLVLNGVCGGEKRGFFWACQKGAFLGF